MPMGNGIVMLRFTSQDAHVKMFPVGPFFLISLHRQEWDFIAC